MIIINKGKNVVISSFLVGIIVVAILGISYAYFTSGISGGETASTIETTAGKMQVAFAGGNNIVLENIYPRTEEWVTKIFTITGNNTTELEMKYKLSLVVQNNTFTTNALKLNLTSTNTNSNGVVVNGTTKNLTTGPSTIDLGTGYFNTANGAIHTYVIKIYFPNTSEDQNINQKKQFASYVAIESIQ